jgi:hypothetical protein
MKSGIQTYFFLASNYFRNVLVLVVVKKIQDPRGVKCNRFGSATLVVLNTVDPDPTLLIRFVKNLTE